MWILFLMGDQLLDDSQIHLLIEKITILYLVTQLHLMGLTASLIGNSCG